MVPRTSVSDDQNARFGSGMSSDKTHSLRRVVWPSGTQCANCPLVLALVLGACDPGWHYQATSGTAIQVDGLRYDIPSSNPKVRIYASAFTSSLDVELTLTNIESQPLRVALPELSAFDARGTSLREHFPIRRNCQLTDNVMVIPAGGACTPCPDPLRVT